MKPGDYHCHTEKEGDPKIIIRGNLQYIDYIRCVGSKVLDVFQCDKCGKVEIVIAEKQRK